MIKWTLIIYFIISFLIFIILFILEGLDIEIEIELNDLTVKDIFLRTSLNPYTIYEKTDFNFPTCCILSGILILFNIPWILLILISTTIAIPIYFLMHIGRNN